LRAHSGEYIINGTFALNLTGRSDAPISIKGTVVDGRQQTTIKQEGTSNNVLNVAGTYFGLYNLTLTCSGTCLRGLSMVGATSHATFEDLVIHHTNRTAFGATATGVDYNALTVRRVEVFDTGLDTSECFLFGCASDQCRIHGSTIELNYCHDISDTMTNYGAGIQLNSGSYSTSSTSSCHRFISLSSLSHHQSALALPCDRAENIIRNNVVSKTNAAGIRVFDDYGKGVNLIEGNAVTQTKGNGIQVSSGAVVRNNIITDVAAYGIAVSNTQLKTSNNYHDIQIVHNTVIRSNTADLMLPALSGDDFVVVNNAFLSANSFSVGQQTSTVVWRKNAYVGGSIPSGVPESSLILVNASSVVGEKFYPTNTSALINAGTGSYTTRVAWDYNGTPRSATSPTIGAYVRSLHSPRQAKHSIRW
jgi:hypothetical protein